MKECCNSKAFLVNLLKGEEARGIPESLALAALDGAGNVGNNNAVGKHQLPCAAVVNFHHP